MPFALVFLTSVIVVEVVGLGWVLILRDEYQRHERRAYGYPDFRLPLWAKAYWTAILTLLFLALADVSRGHAPLPAAIFCAWFALTMVVKIVIYAWFPRLREKWVTMRWPRIAISKALLAAIAFVVLVYSL
ncbi:MAG TPA: hypothetical protein PLU30_27655 [Verrucomicrobiae bacterium]|nr:hypothetical protein [Verrucomicrobiae bacterium]